MALWGGVLASTAWLLVHSLPLTVVLVLGERTKEKAAHGVFLASLDLEALEVKSELSTVFSFFCL